MWLVSPTSTRHVFVAQVVRARRGVTLRPIAVAATAQGLSFGHAVIGVLVGLSGMASCSLPFQEKCLWKRTFATNLERSEVFVPRSLRRFWLGFAPQLQLVKVLS